MFTYLPVERGDTLDQGKAAEAVRALYKTGFFEDISIDHQGSILVIKVTERPAINKLTLAGNKDLKTEDLTKGLKDIGLAEGETYNPVSYTHLDVYKRQACSAHCRYKTCRPRWMNCMS